MPQNETDAAFNERKLQFQQMQKSLAHERDVAKKKKDAEQQRKVAASVARAPASNKGGTGNAGMGEPSRARGEQTTLQQHYGETPAGMKASLSLARAVYMTEVAPHVFDHPSWKTALTDVSNLAFLLAFNLLNAPQISAPSLKYPCAFFSRKILISQIGAAGPGWRAPSAKVILGRLLDEEAESVEKDVRLLQSSAIMSLTGQTLSGDGATDNGGRPVLNFMLIGGVPVFLDVQDCSGDAAGTRPSWQAPPAADHALWALSDGVAEARHVAQKAVRAAIFDRSGPRLTNAHFARLFTFIHVYLRLFRASTRGV